MLELLHKTANIFGFRHPPYDAYHGIGPVPAGEAESVTQRLTQRRLVTKGVHSVFGPSERPRGGPGGAG